MTIGVRTDNVSQRNPDAGRGEGCFEQEGSVTLATAREHRTNARTSADRAAEARGQNEAMRVLSYLIAGVVCYGGIGWLLDRWLDTKFLMPIGLVLGAGLGIYIVIRRLAHTEAAAEEKTTTTGKERR